MRRLFLAPSLVLGLALLAGCATTRVEGPRPGDPSTGPPIGAPEPESAPPAPSQPKQQPKQPAKPKSSQSQPSQPSQVEEKGGVEPEWVASRTGPETNRTVAQVVRSVGPAAESRLKDRFTAAGVAYPPERADLLVFKQERRVELWATRGARRALAATFPMLDQSGTTGPKLREGDEQIPEGIYRVTWLNPNSDYHLSMKLDYPNRFDRAKAREDGRRDLGGDIFVHGGDVSIGCVAIGDAAIEELFLLASKIGIERVRVIVAPWDLRVRPAPAIAGKTLPWVPELYAQLTSELSKYHQ